MSTSDRKSERDVAGLYEAPRADINAAGMMVQVPLPSIGDVGLLLLFQLTSIYILNARGGLAASACRSYGRLGFALGAFVFALLRSNSRVGSYRLRLTTWVTSAWLIMLSASAVVVILGSFHMRHPWVLWPLMARVVASGLAICFVTTPLSLWLGAQRFRLRRIAK
jgi:hypothetical protein